MSSISKEELFEIAKTAREGAVAPFSNFKVGAALESEDGRIFTGCNIENASYGLTICAERVAIFKAVSEGVRKFRRITVIADASEITPPCGACRQIIWEFCGNVPVVMFDLEGNSEEMMMSELLPKAFDSGFLGDS
jgi:cytidine deaminase